jgi:hypothetical protein
VIDPDHLSWFNIREAVDETDSRPMPVVLNRPEEADWLNGDTATRKELLGKLGDMDGRVMIVGAILIAGILLIGGFSPTTCTKVSKIARK